MAPEKWLDRCQFETSRLLILHEDLTGMAAICSNARSRHALLISRSLRASSSCATSAVDAISLTIPLGSWNKLVGP